MDSSRIFVRGLPPNLTADEFRQHFSKQCEITDAKLIPHRRIGYIGYKSNSDAAKAIKYHNRSFIRMSKIAVEVARSVEDQLSLKSQANAGRGNHKALLAVPRSNIDSSDQRKRKRDDLTKHSENGKLQEYLEVMQPSSKSKIWSNEDLITNPGLNPIPNNHLNDELGDEEYEPVPKKPVTPLQTEEPGGILHTIDEKSHENINVALPIDHIPNDNVQPIDPLAPVPSDEDWLRSRTSRLLDLPGTDELLDLDTSTSQYHKTEAEKLTIHAEPTVKAKSDAVTQTDDGFSRKDLTLDSSSDLRNEAEENFTRLFVRNLSYTTTAKDLREYLETQGLNSIEEIHIPKDYRTGNSKGFAYMQYKDPLAAKNALDGLDGKSFQGRLMHVIPAIGKKHKGLDEFAISKLPLKKQQQIQRKAEAASTIFNWNSLYMNSNAVLSSISDRLGVSKSALLDPTSSAAAVKQAHAETYIIQETKAYFAANGVNLDAFKLEERSDTAILVKNFAYGTKPEELRGLFEPYGTILKILMPPSGTISIVEFERPEHARSAFGSLAYRKFKDTILFLEKAPRTLFRSEILHSNERKSQPVMLHDKKISIAQLREDEVPRLEVDTSTLFVRNLNFSTTTDRLRETFEPLEGFASARVKMKPNPKRPGQFLSMGFGFLEFRSKQQARAAMVSMDGYRLDGHDLLLRASHKSVDAAEERRKEDQAKKTAGRTTKIIIKNLPFEASKKDIRSLFSAYGQLRSIRVPLKFDNSTRGFAFADFVTIREAENAMAALKDTHFLGRRLALDFAAEDALDPEKEIETMQKKVGKQANKVALQQVANVARQKFNFDGGEDIEMD